MMKRKKRKCSTSQTKKNTTNNIQVLNKYGVATSRICLEVAKFSVASHKAIWVNKHTIQLLYDRKDILLFNAATHIRDDYTCFYCGKQMEPGHKDLTVDHVYPRSHGGSVLPSNLATSCFSCNNQKNHFTYQEYLICIYAGILSRYIRYIRKEEEDE